jgi:hypothetical protein
MGEGRPYSVRLYREGDEDQIIGLLQAAFGSWPRVEVSVPPVEHLRWKLHSHPLAPRNHTIGTVGDRVAGFALCFALPVLIRGRMRLGRMGVDACLHPDFQGAGLLRTSISLRRPLATGGFDLGFTGHSLDPRVRRITPSWGLSRFGDQLSRIEVPAAGADRPGEPWSVVDREETDARFDRLWEEAAGQFDLICLRDAARLSWRYCDRRAGDFRLKAAEQDGRVLGYAVLTLLRGKGYFADLLALPGRTDVVRSLVREGLAWFRSAGASRARCWLPARHPYHEALATLPGAQVEPRDRPLGFWAHPDVWEELRFLREPGVRLHYTYGDSDYV